MTEHHHDDRGASAVEYGLLVAGIAAIVVGTVLLFGGFVDGVFQDSCDDIAAEAQRASC